MPRSPDPRQLSLPSLAAVFESDRCPFCDRRMGRHRLRVHLAAEGCVLAPGSVAVAYTADEIKTVREREYVKTITTVARAHGWRWFHVEPARAGKDGRWYTATTGDPGVPDLWLVRGDRLVVLEVKTKRGRARPGQAPWIAALDRVPGVTALMGVTPAEWPEIQALLVSPSLVEPG